MPLWLLPFLLKYGVPVVIAILEKSGLTNWAEKVAVKAGYSLLEDVKGLKRYSAPSDYPNPPNPNPTPNNLTVTPPSGE